MAEKEEHIIMKEFTSPLPSKPAEKADISGDWAVFGQWFKDYITHSPRVPPLILPSDGTGTTRAKSATLSLYPQRLESSLVVTIERN